MSPHEFLSSLWGADGQGNLSKVHFIAEKTPGGMIHHPVATVDDALATAAKVSAAGNDAYFACSAFITDANRTADNAAGAQCLWFDLDCGSEKAAKNEGYLTKPDALIALRDFSDSVGLPRPPVLVDSGNGLHCYWYFADFISAGEWRKLARELKRIAAHHGLRADPQRTADIASVLRVPGTMNAKDPNSPKPVTILHFGPAIDFPTFAAIADRQVQELDSNLGPPQQKDGNFPPSSALKIIKADAPQSNMSPNSREP